MKDNSKIKKSVRRGGDDFPATFLPNRIGRAADEAMEEVLEEDRILRQHAAELGL